MKLRRLWSLGVVSAITLWAGTSTSKSEKCALAEKEVAQTCQKLSDATREADARAASYQGCVEAKTAERCTHEQRLLRQAMKAKRDAQAAHRYAVAKAQQACGPK